MTAYDELMAFQHDTEALAQISGRLGWDQETVMPRGAVAQRGLEMAAIEAVLHARRSDPRVGDWLERATPADAAAAAQLREIRRGYDRARKVPGELAKRLAQVTSEAQGKWAAARAAGDVAAFLPVLDEVVRLKREEGQALAAGTGDVYDAMLEDYEPGTTGAQIAAIFDAMRPRLVALRAAIRDRPAPKDLMGRFDEAAQLRLSHDLARTFGYDLYRGRIDKAVHPFSSGSGADVRITTRTAEDDPFNCLYSTIHEVGHAAYEQGIDAGYALTPLGRGVSMGVHESQSRIYENQIGRGRAFTGWLFGRMREAFGDFGIDDAEAFHAAVNKVRDGFIRTEADEVQYNLHIMLRFDLERALMSGDLQVGDLETAWNDRFAADFGYAVDRPANGCLQDVHWSVGLFGYFPTYALGNVYAGCLWEAMNGAVPDLGEGLARGDVSAATGWLRENLQRHGGLYPPREVIGRASGRAPDEAPLLAYLEAKFGEIYGL
ncbi:carboxypeptidase M32 [Pukyongiella litopenaei]|uniref:Metal-dependent carboxypeptidase n=1 Tax=Pukyongiella litopenaei TaxID=2605946 RepID=A0A2S0MKS6_9RHOB|nr:carboxypeptidase M32 [Pukyongiella litopenaei]AVO36462.1 carboxypeptidase M32 [Pukyongiella litopenaei]